MPAIDVALRCKALGTLSYEELKLFSIKQWPVIYSERLNKLDRLVDGDVFPETDAQTHFRDACLNKCPPETPYEHAFIKYREILMKLWEEEVVRRRLEEERKAERRRLSEIKKAEGRRLWEGKTAEKNLLQSEQDRQISQINETKRSWKKSDQARLSRGRREKGWQDF